MTERRYLALLSNYKAGDIAHRDYLDLRREWNRRGLLGPSIRDHEANQMAARIDA